MRILLVIVFLVVSVSLFGQSTAIILDNTEVIRCEIVEDSAEVLTIRMPDTTFVRIDKRQVFKVVPNDASLSDRQMVKKNYEPIKGFSFRFFLAITSARRYSPGSTGFNYFGLSAVPALQYSNWISLGIGTGIRYSNPTPIYPLAIDFRLSGRSRVAPILVLGAGRAYTSDGGFRQLGDIRYGEIGIDFKNLSGGSFSILVGLDHMPRYNSLGVAPASFIPPDETVLRTYSYTFTLAMRF